MLRFLHLAGKVLGVCHKIYDVKNKLYVFMTNVMEKQFLCLSFDFNSKACNFIIGLKLKKT